MRTYVNGPDATWPATAMWSAMAHTPLPRWCNRAPYGRALGTPSVRPRGCTGASRPARAPSPRCGPSTLAAIFPFKKAIHQRSQFGEVDVLGDGLQRVSHLIALALARGVRKEIELQGAARADHAVARVGAGDSGNEWVGFERFP